MSRADFDYFQKDEVFHGYRIERLLGRGGIGAVYLARHEVLDTYYALKILSPTIAAENAIQVKRFLREARLATRIRHSNLVTVHDCGYDDVKGFYYLVMDYVAGNSLRAIMAFEGAMDVPRAADIIAQTCLALQASQAFQVVHRDIKPENIMVQPDGLVKLLDLGIAKAQNLGDSVETNTDSTFGTPAYVSPEQALSSTNVDLRADIYSLGVVFFEMLTGVCPYRGHNAAETLAQILSDNPPPDIRDVKCGLSADAAILVRRMMVKEVDRRIASYDEVLRQLARLGCSRVAAPQPVGEIASKPEVGMKTLLEGISTEPIVTPRGSRRSLFHWFKHTK